MHSEIEPSVAFYTGETTRIRHTLDKSINFYDASTFVAAVGQKRAG